MKLHVKYSDRAARQDVLHKTFDYDPNTGVFTWKHSRYGAKQGAPAGRSVRCGSAEFVEILFLRCHRQAHYLAWLYVNGRWPEGALEHINGDTTDNRYINLREVPKRQRRQRLKQSADALTPLDKL